MPQNVDVFENALTQANDFKEIRVITSDNKSQSVTKEKFVELIDALVVARLKTLNIENNPTGIVVQNGTRFGNMTPQNLASVLGVMKGIKRWSNTGSNDATQTDILANSGSFGNTVLVVASDHNDAGDATVSGLFLVRIGYDGNHVASEKIAELIGNGAYTHNFIASIVDGRVALSGYRRYLTIECRL